MYILWSEGSSIRKATFYEKYLTMYTIQKPDKIIGLSSFNHYLEM